LLNVGIVGLPNSGKSTLFNALLKKQIADTTNYPFCTIEPNKGIVRVPDERLPVLASIVKTERIVPAVVEFIDIAGLIKGASKGEGLGNKFLAHIREVVLIIHMVRFFKDEGVIHTGGKIDPCADVETINSELILADLEALERQKEPRGRIEKEEELFFEAVRILKDKLNQGVLAKDVALMVDQRKAVKNLFLLTDKSVIYVANLGEEQLTEAEKKRKEFPFEPAVFISAKAEAGLDRLIEFAYKSLGLISFLTAGEKEVRAWTIKAGMSAREAAGVIHSDFKERFVKAEVISFEEFVKYNGWEKARLLGKIRIEGKDYLVQDGDVILFRKN